MTNQKEQHSGGTIRSAALPSWGREASRIDTHTGEGEAQEGTCGRCCFVLGAVMSLQAWASLLIPQVLGVLVAHGAQLSCTQEQSFSQKDPTNSDLLMGGERPM